MGARGILAGLMLFAVGCAGGCDDGARLIGTWSAVDATTGREAERLILRSDGTFAHRTRIVSATSAPDYQWIAGTWVADGTDLHLDGRDAYDGHTVSLDVGYRLDGDDLSLRDTDPVTDTGSATYLVGDTRVLQRVAP
jgi:hypothetical protein